jgi:hypothetical protein
MVNSPVSNSGSSFLGRCPEPVEGEIVHCGKSESREVIAPLPKVSAAIAKPIGLNEVTATIKLPTANFNQLVLTLRRLVFSVWTSPS